MKRGSTNLALRQIQTLYTLGALGGMTDTQLLEIFLTRAGNNAEDAFAALVSRHGPMVLAACRRMLPGLHDAEDAFQATFLVLVRRAKSIGRREQLANWLYGVAVRTSKETRRSAARRLAWQKRVTDMAKLELEPAADRDDLIPLLDEELSRLPGRYRAALVACELEGKSRREAAQQLGLREGTLSTHLARGRKLLRERLIKRGASLAVAAMAGVTAKGAQAAVPDRLLASTVRAATAYASGGVAAGTVSATVAAIAKRVLKTMVLTKLGLVVAAVMAVGITTLTAYKAWATAPPRRAELAQVQVATKAENSAQQAALRQARVRGAVVDEAGKPVAGVDVMDNGNHQAHSVTDELGRFEFRVPRPLLSGTLLVASTADRTRQGIYRFDNELLESDTAQPVRITLKPSQEVGVRVTDKAGEPVNGAVVETLPSFAVAMTASKGTAVLRVPAEAPIARIIGLKAGRGFDDFQHGEAGTGYPATDLPGTVHLVLDGARTVRVQAIDSAGKPLAGISFVPWVVRKVGKRETNVFTFGSEMAQTKTDKHGIATFDWIPQTTVPVIFRPRSEGYQTAASPGLQEGEAGTTLTARLLRAGTIRGRVIRPDGKPGAGILVMTEERRGGSIRFVRVRTAADGSYEMAVNSNQSYVVEVADDEWAAASHDKVMVPEGRPVEGLDFQLVRGTLVHGILTIGSDRRPAEGRNVLLRPQMRMERSATTDAEGRYHIRVGPGTYSVQVPFEHLAGEQVSDIYEWSPENPASKSHKRNVVVQTFSVKNEEELIRDLWIPTPETGQISGRVVLAKDPARGVAGARVQGISMPPRWEATVADSNGHFRALRRLEKTVVHARSPDGLLAGLVEIGGDQSEIVILVSPTATAKGIILEERGNPIANAEVSSGRRIRMDNGHDDYNERLTPTTLTDERGRFALPELIVGQEYMINVPAGDRSWHVVAYVKPQEAGPLELGTLQVGTGRLWPFRAGKPSVGDAAPSFAAQTLAGMPLKLEDFHGRFVLLDFWDTGCAPCARDIPQLQAIQEAFGRDERFVILTLSVDETIDAPRQFQEKRPLPGIQGFLGKGIDGAVPDSYGVRAIPALVLVGPDGKIVAKGMEGAEIQNAVARAFK